MKVLFHTESPEETERLGAALASCLSPSTVVALRGQLASGKTCFVRGMASHFGVSAVHSPTFTLINEYGGSPKLYHMDLYRLHSLDEVADLGCEELFASNDCCAVEWAERAEGLLPQDAVSIAFEHGGGDVRKITIEDRGRLADGWEEALRQSTAK